MRRKKKQTNAKKYNYKGVNLKSGLELEMFKQLEAARIPFQYEGRKFTIINGFKYDGTSYERFMKGTGKFIDRGNKDIPDMVYTPDFIPKKGLKWIIETKGRAMPDFARTWKLFKKLITEEGWDTVLFLPRTKKDCAKVVEIIKRDKL